MLVVLGTSMGIAIVGAMGLHHRARNRWVSPYTNLASAMRVVTRTEPTEFRPSGLVALRPAPVAAQAEVFDLRHERALRSGHSAAV
jgi:hypothetical protein